MPVTVIVLVFGALLIFSWAAVECPSACAELIP